MDVCLTKRYGVLVPATKQDEELLGDVKSGETVRVKVTRPRNPYHHRKMFALLNLVLENSDFRSIDHLLTDLKVRVGHYEEYITADGAMVFIPKSISFASMGQAEFNVFYNRVLNTVIENYMPMDADDLERQVERVLQFS
jgi:hypothetical protein